MIFVQLMLVFSVVVVFLAPIEGQNRRLQPIEHSFCSLMFADELANAKTIDRRAIIQAYRIGRNGTACATNCRVVSRGNQKPLGAVPSPDFIECAPGPQFCYKGNCTTDKGLSQILKTTLIKP